MPLAKRGGLQDKYALSRPIYAVRNCIPAKAGERYFPAALISAAAVKDKPIFRFAADDSFTFEKAEKREKQILRWFKDVKPVLLSAENLRAAENATRQS